MPCESHSGDLYRRWNWIIRANLFNESFKSWKCRVTAGVIASKLLLVMMTLLGGIAQRIQGINFSRTHTHSARPLTLAAQFNWWFYRINWKLIMNRLTVWIKRRIIIEQRIQFTWIGERHEMRCRKKRSLSISEWPGVHGASNVPLNRWMNGFDKWLLQYQFPLNVLSTTKGNPSRSMSFNNWMRAKESAFLICGLLLRGNPLPFLKSGTVAAPSRSLKCVFYTC